MKFFGSTRALRLLNVSAVGLALASCTSVVLATIMQAHVLATGPSTLVAGILWSLCMRSTATVPGTSVRTGWLWSVPIAMLNAGVSCSLFLLLDGADPHASSISVALLGMIAGPLVGVVVWGPALVLVLCVFGIPIAWSQQLARRGLAGEERGEVVVGAVCVVLAVFGWLLARYASQGHAWTADPTLAPGSGLWFPQASAALAAAAGAAAILLAIRRERQRRAFVRRVAAGAAPGFRIEETPAGRALVRVTELGSAYRVASFTEELYRMEDVVSEDSTPPRASAPVGMPPRG